MRGTLIVLALLHLAPPALAKTIVFSPTAELFVWPSSYSYHGTWVFHVSAASHLGFKGERGLVQIHCKGATLAGSDSIIPVVPNRDYRWTLTCNRTGDGPIQVRSTLRVDSYDPGSYDMYTYLVVADFGHLHDDVDTVLIREFRRVQALAVRNGMRFRCDGDYPVAVGDDEGEVPRFYRRRAKVKTQKNVHCSDCLLMEPIDVGVVVTVGTKGNVTWAKPNGQWPSATKGKVSWVYGERPGADDVPESAVDPIIWAAVERDLPTFRYQAAMSGDGPVADYVVLRVHVVP